MIVFHTNTFKLISTILFIDKEMIKRIVIAGVSCALDYKEKYPKSSQSDVMTFVSRELNHIIRNVEEDEE